MVRLNSISKSSHSAPASGTTSVPVHQDMQVKANTPDRDAAPRTLHSQDLFVPASSQPRVQAAGVVEPHGQRERALAVVRQAPPGSVGAAIRPLLERAMAGLGAGGATFAMGGGGPLGVALAPRVARMTREFAAGQVGTFYERQRALLNSPATDANIAEFSRRETEFFRTQSWLPRIVGRLMSAEDRAGVIRYSRDNGLGQ
jgi:hypothetical protein